MDGRLVGRGNVPSLVGRGAELAVLHDALESVKQGHLRVVFSSGEPGIGKSRLLDEFPSREVTPGEAMVLRGGATRGEGLPPFLPFVEAIGDYCSAVDTDVLHVMVGRSGPVLATILPVLEERLGPLQTAPRLPPEEERVRLFEAITGLLSRSASATPLILCLDDLQWSDAATCDLLVHIARRLSATRLLILGAYRDAEANDNPPFVDALADLNRLRVLRILPLRPLGIEDSTALARALLADDVDPSLAATLHRQGEGNPFYLEELTRGLAESGSLERGEQGWALHDDAQVSLPAGLQLTIRSRLNRLPKEVLEILDIAAVIGRVFALDLVAAVAESDVDSLELLLRPAVRGALVRPRADGRYSFTHDTIREVVYGDVPLARAKRLHLAIGTALESVAPRELEQLAFHFTRAGDVDRGVRSAQAAGEHALASHAPAEAATFFQQAANLLAAVPEDARAAQLLVFLGEAHTRRGVFGAAVTAFRSAAAIAERSGDRALAADAWRRIGVARWRQEQVLEARTAFERALDLSRDVAELTTAETLLQLADLLALSMGEHAEAQRCAARALQIVKRADDDRLAALASRAMGSVCFRANRLAEGRAHLEEALTLALRQDDVALAAEICGHLASATGFAGDLARSREVTLLRRQLAERVDDPFLRRHVATWLGVLAAFQGRWQEVERHLAEAAPEVARVDSPEPRAFLHVVRGLVAFYRGELRAALREFQDAQTTISVLGSNAGVWFNGWTGMVYVELGRPAEALRSFTELQQPADLRDAHDSINAYACSQLIHGYFALGERQRAADCYDRLLPFSGQVQCFVIDRALAVAAACRGQSDLAERHFEAAVDLAERADLRPELTLTYLQHGALQRQLLRQAAAQESFMRGERLASELGMEKLAQSVVARGLPPVSVSSVPLSKRQLEVLRLVAQGRTNREIAERLVLTEGTVANHLSAVFARIGADNRAAAVAYALRHGLA